ncbi:MAG: phosphate-starvation-inducible PsiE family protein [candidate division KSB1 bacterium]|nr:phosphate-starvation-inducible PsiE family protein [candidate division KSB1 bacterium]
MKIIAAFERGVVFVLLLLMVVVLVIGTVELAVMLYQSLIRPPFLLFDLTNLLEIFGTFLMVLIGLELLETIKVYWQQNKFHLEEVLIVSIIAVARKVILVDSKTFSADFLLGMAALILALAVSYFLVQRKRRNITDSTSEKQ